MFRHLYLVSSFLVVDNMLRFTVYASFINIIAFSYIGILKIYVPWKMKQILWISYHTQFIEAFPLKSKADFSVSFLRIYLYMEKQIQKMLRKKCHKAQDNGIFLKIIL